MGSRWCTSSPGSLSYLKAGSPRPEPKLGAVLKLPHCVLDAGDRDCAHANQAVGSHGHVLFGEELVVGADQLQIKTVILRLSQHKGNLRKENLRLYSVLVLLAQALFGGAGAGV